MASTISSVDLGLFPSRRMADLACLVMPPFQSTTSHPKDKVARVGGALTTNEQLGMTAQSEVRSEGSPQDMSASGFEKTGFSLHSLALSQQDAVGVGINQDRQHRTPPGPTYKKTALT